MFKRACGVLVVLVLAGLFLVRALNGPQGSDDVKQSPVAYWQSYSQSPENGVHEFVEGHFDYQIERLASPSEDFHTGYAFIHKGDLYFEDLGNGYQFKLLEGGGYQQVHLRRSGDYRAANHEFSFDYKTSEYSACSTSGSRPCQKIRVNPGTFPYVYANANGAVITVTNYGDALLFRRGRWCRMTMENDIYSCARPVIEPLSKPRAIQFYSSISYRGKQLLGEWPTGRIYEFDGAQLKPSDMTPPKIAELVPQRLGFEAQSMAEYCGDLFVGYWPKGEVWRYDHQAEHWQLLRRFFSAVEGETFVPYMDRAADTLDSAFFGQRVTALVPHGDALYVATSNLRTWRANDAIPDVMNPARLAEYGALYKVTRQGCKTTYASAQR